MLLHPYIPGSAERLLVALGRSELDLDGARYGARSGGASVTRIPPLFPKRD